MKIPVNLNLVLFFFPCLIFVAPAAAVKIQSCEGNGTQIFFGNGMFTLPEEAEENLDDLSRKVGKNCGTPSSPVKFSLAYKRDEEPLEQLFYAYLQKMGDETLHFWVWIAGLEDAPGWFKDLAADSIKTAYQIAARSYAADVYDHMESYAQAVREGYNVVLVSHSQGNFYANQVMQHLGSHSTVAYPNSINDKNVRNRNNYPALTDLVANVQVATPVSKTIGDSPWTTFKDDFIIKSIPRALGLPLPPNVLSSGVGIPPSGDLLGHSFIKSYLRVEESRNKIVSDINQACSRLRYPIPFFQRVPMIDVRESLSRNEGIPITYFHLVSEDENGDSNQFADEFIDEESNHRYKETFYGCTYVPLGTTYIRASIAVESVSKPWSDVEFRIWPGAVKEKQDLIRKVVNVQGIAVSENYEIGLINVSASQSKEPLQIEMHLHDVPKRIKNIYELPKK